MICKASIIVALIFAVVDCGPVLERRDAFDPEQLMAHYMDMRTNQGLFGSYHPNDLVKSIVNYFNHEGQKAINNNQWGLSLYNPNDKIGQYIGNLATAGNLGPQPLTNGNSQPGDESTFDPDSLNQKLMQDAFSKGNRYSDFVPQAQETASNGQNNFGYNADILNRQMMESAMSKYGANSGSGSSENTPTQAPNTDDNGTKGDNTIVEAHAQTSPIQNFNPDMLNAGLLQSVATVGETGAKPTITAGHKTNTAIMLGFNPDTLNAGLIGSLGYNPNSAMSKIPTYNGNGMTAQETVDKSNTENGQITHAIMGKPDTGNGQIAHETMNKPDTGNGQIATGPTVETNIKDKAGSHGMSNNNVVPFLATGMAGINGDELGSSQNGEAFNNGGAASGNYNMAESGHNSSTAMFTGSQVQGQKLTASNGSIGQFTAGEIGPQGQGSQNSGAPPGIPAGTVLQQTEHADAKANGIGGMG